MQPVQKTNPKPLTVSKQSPVAEAYTSPGARLLVNIATSLMVTLGIVDPIAGGALTAFDAGLVAQINRRSQRRVEVFVEELQKQGLGVTEELLHSDAFLEALREVVEIVSRERREEKILIFARLFSNAAESGNLNDDRYQEFQQILQDTSLREIQVLLLLHRFEATTDLPNQPGSNNELLRAMNFWPAFCSEAEQEIGLAPGEIEGVLTRLARTGLYKGFDGMSIGDPGGMGRLTIYFGLFVQWVKEQPQQSS